MYKPFLNFLFAFLIPAACIYFFADKSLGTIAGLREANKVLADSLSDGDHNAVVIHDTVYRQQPGKPKPGKERPTKGGVDSIKWLTGLVSTYEGRIDDYKEELGDKNRVIDSLLKTKRGVRVIHDTVFVTRPSLGGSREKILRDSINYLAGLLKQCRSNRDMKYEVLVKQLRDCKSKLKPKDPNVE